MGAVSCFSGAMPMSREGAVFETDAKKAVTLLKQRPTWAVYESDCVWSLHNGVASHLDINLLTSILTAWRGTGSKPF